MIINEKLDGILFEMEKCYDNDQEAGHCDADELLLKLISILVESIPNIDIGIIKKIVSKYENLPKWYA